MVLGVGSMPTCHRRGPSRNPAALVQGIRREGSHGLWDYSAALTAGSGGLPSAWRGTASRGPSLGGRCREPGWARGALGFLSRMWACAVVERKGLALHGCRSPESVSKEPNGAPGRQGAQGSDGGTLKPLQPTLSSFTSTDVSKRAARGVSGTRAARQPAPLPGLGGRTGLGLQVRTPRCEF